MRESDEEKLTRLKQHELEIYQKNPQIQYICGIDEAGRGPLAGPVVVGAVIMPKESWIKGVNDSKKIAEKKGKYYLKKLRRKRLLMVLELLIQKQSTKSTF